MYYLLNLHSEHWLECTIWWKSYAGRSGTQIIHPSSLYPIAILSILVCWMMCSWLSKKKLAWLHFTLWIKLWTKFLLLLILIANWNIAWEAVAIYSHVTRVKTTWTSLSWFYLQLYASKEFMGRRTWLGKSSFLHPFTPISNFAAIWVIFETNMIA